MPAFKPLDPARLRHKVTFVRELAMPDGYGGHTMQVTKLLQTWAAKDQVKDASQLAINAGLSAMNEDAVITIRHRAEFQPAKDMQVKEGARQYVIKAYEPVGEPVAYWRISCKRLS